LARLCAAAICDLLGRVDEADRWLDGIPEDQRPRESTSFNLALVAATLGGAPGAVAGYQGQVASAAFQVINERVTGGEISAFQIIITGLLKHAAKRRCKDLPLKHDDGIWRALADAISHSGGVPKDGRFFVLQASQALLSAVVLRARPLSGERVSTALRVVEGNLARAVEEGYAAAVADLLLLLAFLAARDGRFDEALARYEEVARDNPFDLRPLFLATSLCTLVRRPVEEANKWQDRYKRVTPWSPIHNRVALMTLTEELAVVVALASPTAFDVRCPMRMCFIVRAAGSRVDAALLSALRSKNLSVVEWMEARAVRAFLFAGMWSALKEWEGKDAGRGTTAN
ncbi:hypothetical protein BAE44_0002692, partial [Dichanthelium oligosanthes]